jgi:segregation and condensation protein A
MTEAQAHDAGPVEAGPSQIRVLLPVFEGPLDLLLHLIRSNKMDIFDIPIMEIARQYDGYIDLMKEMDLEIAGEFLVMAATLAHIKSRMLLPSEKPPEGEPSEDPRAELTRQLLEFQRYKLAAESLQAMESVQGLIWVRPPRDFPELAIEPELVVDLYSLMAAFKKLMDQVAATARLRPSGERVSVAEKIRWLSATLEGEGSVSFADLLSSLRSRAEMIATFLALLELIRQRLAVAHQREPLGEIWVSAPAAPAGTEEQHG